jgi:hypothetical protein
MYDARFLHRLVGFVEKLMYDARFLHRLVAFVEKGEHRPAGGQPFRDVAARTAGAEHPTFVIVGCGACILFRHINKFYHVYKKVNIINKEKRMRYMLL